MTARLVNFMLNASRTIDSIGGSVAELGVYQGDTASILAAFCKGKKSLFLFDTFEGFSREDLVGIDGTLKPSFENTSISCVKDAVKDTENIHFIKGHFPDSIPEICQNEQYCFVHIDCDLYIPIKNGLDYFWPRMSQGGMIIVHDYSSGHWAGAAKAVDEFRSENHLSAVCIPDLSGSVAFVKQ